MINTVEPALSPFWGALAMGLSLGILAFIGSGGASVIKHYMVRFLLARDPIIPFDLKEILIHATQIGMLRQVGGGFIFVHRYLLEYFASQINSHY